MTCTCGDEWEGSDCSQVKKDDESVKKDDNSKAMRIGVGVGIGIGVPVVVGAIAYPISLNSPLFFQFYL